MEHFNAEEFYAGLDAIFAEHRGSTDAEPYLDAALKQAQSAQDSNAELTVISEFLGFDRSHGRHEHSRMLCERALQLREELKLAGSMQSTIILINVATAYRQAHEYSLARKYYDLAAQEAETSMPDTDRQKAALYNNFSMLFSETGDIETARRHMTHALHLMRVSSSHPDKDPDIATTLTNLGLLDIQLGDTASALDHTQQGLDIYTHNPVLQQSAHYTSALAGYAQALYTSGKVAQSLEFFEQALDLIGQYYGTESDYYTTTAQNVDIVRESLAQVESEQATVSQVNISQTDTDETPAHSPDASESISGLQLSRRFWEATANELFSGDLADVRARAAVGLVGHGSECYGFDDVQSHDHDFGARYCVWLTPADFEQFGAQLQERYEALDKNFLGFKPATKTPRSAHREGVMSIDAFFESMTGLSHAPAESGEEHLWLGLDEATLAAATNGEIFADPVGAFSSRRQGFKNMPDDVRLFLISQRLGMIAQTGQYNYPRMKARHDEAAMALTINEFALNVSSLVFLMNNPISAGYAPYYKWRFAALRRLSNRMGTKLSNLITPLERLVTSHMDYNAQGCIDFICNRIVKQLKAEGLTTSSEDFLEWHRPYVEAHITSTNPLLHSL